MQDVIIAILTVALIGVVCAIILVIAAKYMHVEVDETQVKIRETLPGANCGACGYAGCDGYSKALASGEETRTNLCIPGADKVSKDIAEITGLVAGDVVEQVATVCCMGDCGNAKKKSVYRGIESCSAAKMLYGGNGECTYGCLGYGDCERVCPSGAICVDNGVAHVNTKQCTGCGLCTKACPQGIIALMADVDKVLVTCSSKEKGAVVRNKCTHGCIGCKKCEKNCPTGAIKVENNIASIDYSKCIKCDLCAKNCPVGCIMLFDFSGVHRYIEK